MANNEAIMTTLRDKDLVSKIIMTSCALMFGLLTFHNLSDMNVAMQIFMQPLLIAVAVLSIGIPLGDINPGYGDKFKLVGYVCFFLGFFGIIGSFLGPYLCVIPLICAVFLIVPLLMVLSALPVGHQQDMPP